MTRSLLALAVAGAVAMTLAGCSDSDSGSDDPDTPMTPDAGTGGGSGGGTETPMTPTRPSGPPVPSGSGTPTGDTKAGNYVGTLGFGDGVYVIDADNDLAGLALMEDGSAQSIFGNVGSGDTYAGTLRLQTHDPSVPPSAGVFGAGRTPIESTGEYDLTFVPGQTIEGENASLVFADAGQISPATVASVAGDWRGVNQFTDCDAGGGCRLIFDVNFDGTTVTGSTSVETGAGEQTRLNPFEGTIAEYGDTLLLTFDWTDGAVTNRYDGVAFFPDATGRLVFVGETLAADSGNPTLGSLLSRP